MYNVAQDRSTEINLQHYQQLHISSKLALKRKVWNKKLTLFANIFLESVQVQSPTFDQRNLEGRALELPELGDLVEKVELDPGVGLELVQALDPGREPEPVDVDGERGLPILKEK